MSAAEAVTNSPLAGAAGWTLLHTLWEGAIAAAVLSTILAATRSPRVRYAAACLALLMMLAGAGITFIREMPETGSGMRAANTRTPPEWNLARGGDGADLSSARFSAAVPWLAPIWITGVWLFYLGHVAGWISVSRLRRRGVCCVHERWQKELSRLAGRLSVSRPILLLESALADVPVVLGHFRPVILIPAGLLTGLPPEQVEAILLHELAHIRRYDYAVNFLQHLVEGIFFYHPAAWWIARVIRAERENCCDDAAVAITGNAHQYASALAALEENRWPGPRPAMAITGGNLMKRIRRLLYPEGPAGPWTPLAGAALLLATAAAALAAWQAEPARGTSAAAQPALAAQASPYDKWLNQDVVYIIADAERAAFLKLTTNEERDQFIEQFWLRRDPTPGTPKNEFKEEYSRRFSYANQRFRTRSGGPGWQTDRGHIYLLYGPPDQLEIHPANRQRVYSTELWMYNHVEGLGDHLVVTFIDQTGTGDYRLAPGNAR